MAVPGNTSNYLKNSSDGTFTATNEAGTILGNDYATDSAINNSLALKDNAAPWAKGTLPVNSANGLIANDKPLSGGTFAYRAAGKYVIAASSDTLSGVSKTNILITGVGSLLQSIARFRQRVGAKTVTAFRAGRFSWTKTSRAGAAITSRINWLNVASGGMDAASAPAANNEAMWDVASGALSYDSDVAANPTRAVPGSLVMMVDFVDRDEATSGNFFLYKAITGM